MSIGNTKCAVVFDLDGTLVDLPVDIETARSKIATIFAQRGYTGPMRPILSAINRAAASVAESDEEIYPLIVLARSILDAAEIAAAQRATIRDGAIAAIETFRKLDIPMGIVTNNCKACVAPALELLGCDPAEFMVSARDDVRRPKPAPDGLIRVSDVLATQGDTLYFLGDSPVDISAAVAANPQVAAKVEAFAVVGPHSSAEQLRAAGPCVVHHSLNAAVASICQKLSTASQAILPGR